MRKLLRRLKRLWRLANPDIVQVMCPTCNDLVDAFEYHACPRAIIVIDIVYEKGRRINHE